MIKLLVVDDSALMRRLMRRLFAAAGDFTVEVARDGQEAVERLHEVAPDVVTLDVAMPRMDGLACLAAIMARRPCPVVMVSATTGAGAADAVEALARGAVDAVPKPAGALSLGFDAFAPLLLAKVRAAAGATLRAGRGPGAAAAVLPGPPPRLPEREGGCVLIGASTGGPPALDRILARLPADFPLPVVVAQHMPASFTGALAARLDRLCALAVAEATVPRPLVPGRVFIGKGDADVIVGRRPAGPVVMAAPALPHHRWHPSVDRLVDTAMQHLDPGRLIGVLLTGMGQDGAAAMARLRVAGGRTVAESEGSAVVWGMPGELVRAGGAEAVLPVEAVADHLLEMLR